MEKTFLNNSKPMLTVMLQCETPEVAIGRIRNANCLGADAYGLQVESLKPEYHNPDTYKRIFAEMKGKPCYVTNYCRGNEVEHTDEELTDELLEAVECGAKLIDIRCDLYDRQDGEYTDDVVAV